MSQSSRNSPASRAETADRRRQQQHQQHQYSRDKQSTGWPATNSYLSFNYLRIALICLLCNLIYLSQVACQLPSDIERELNQNLAEQARLQALRARHQQQLQSRTGGSGGGGGGGGQQQGKQQTPIGTQPARPAHDPNNYSYQQVSPPIQYSYYQPYGDLAKQQQGAGSSAQNGKQAAAAEQQQQQQQQPPMNLDLNNLNIDLPDLPTPQAQTAQPVGGNAQQRVQHMTPHFTGVGGLPVLQPVAAANQSPDTFAPAGQAPLQPQAQTAGGPQQGPPLTEADFKDITGGENYGAPGGSDFGMAGNSNDNNNNNNNNNQASGGGDASSEPRVGGDPDAQLREYGLDDQTGGAGNQVQQQQQQQQHYKPQQRQDNSMANMMQDMGGFNPMASGNAQGPRRGGGSGGFDPFGAAGFGGGGFPMGGDLGGAFGAPTGGQQVRRQNRPAAQPAGDFDFASQPSSQSRGGVGGDAAQGAMQGGAPGSLQSLLGNAFPGLGGGQAGSMGLEGLARGNNAPENQLEDGGPQQQQQQQRGRPQRADDNAMDVADLGDRSDGFSGADLGGFEQPTPQNDQDYNYAAAAEPQPKFVPYPDGAPQLVGSLFALGQPQSLTQNRYNALPDKGTYQDYPAYQSGGSDFATVAQVVDGTPRARRPGAGRYSLPSASELAPEHRRYGAAKRGEQYDYARGPPLVSSSGGGDDDDRGQSSLLSRDMATISNSVFLDSDDIVD